jgi:hypothetical protein
MDDEFIISVMILIISAVRFLRSPLNRVESLAYNQIYKRDPSVVLVRGQICFGFRMVPNRRRSKI